MKKGMEWGQRILGIAGILCAAPQMALGAVENLPPQVDVGILPPVFRDVLIILCIVLGVLLLLAVAYLWTLMHESKIQSGQVKRLTGDMKAVTAELRTLQSILMPEQFGKEKGGETEEKSEQVLSFPAAWTYQRRMWPVRISWGFIG